MELGAAMTTYFQGEERLGIALAVVGVALGAGALWVWRTQSGPFAAWLAVPAVVLALGFTGGGVYLAVRTQKQVAELTAQLEADRPALVAAESARMAKVNANWILAKSMWTGVIAGALVLLMVVRREWAAGLGLALLLAATVLFFVDVFAERRAGPYTVALDAARDG